MESELDQDLARIYRELQTVDLRDGADSAAREARLQTAVRAYEDGRIDGLCHDGAWELALAAMHRPTPGNNLSTNALACPDAGES